MKPRGISLQKLCELTGADRGSAKKWLIQAGEKPIRTRKTKGAPWQFYDEARAVAIIQSRSGRRNGQHNGEANIDPETGLTWHQRKEREEALSKARENEIADKLKNEEWVSAAFMHSKFSNFVIALEQIPGKLKSESGLTDKQALAVRRAIDEARESASKEVEKEEAE